MSYYIIKCNQIDKPLPAFFYKGPVAQLVEHMQSTCVSIISSRGQ